jgi:hypothetical protein
MPEGADLEYSRFDLKCKSRDSNTIEINIIMILH